MLPILRIDTTLMLSDTDQWQHRFNIKSESSNRLYTIAQHKLKKHWGCSCPAWKSRRKCKHLQALGIPPNEQPYEPNIINN